MEKSVGAYFYLPLEWKKGLERLIWLKYYDVQKRQITFTLGLDVAKNTDYMEERFK